MSPKPHIPTSPSSQLPPDLYHKLGYSSLPASARKHEIETTMHNLKNWLDYANEEETTVQPSKRVRTDSCMGPPAILIASTGSIRRKKRETARLAVPPPAHLRPSNNTTHLGSIVYTPRRDTRPEGLESFPAFAGGVLEVDEEPVKEEQMECVIREKQGEVMRRMGVIGKVMMWFTGGKGKGVGVFNWCQ
jgi:hypothetical protein